jgi:hypothetical protein
MSISKSIYEELVLESNDQKRTVDIKNGAIALEYFEDIFSPTITARVKVVNTGNTSLHLIRMKMEKSNQFIMVFLFVVVKDFR